MTTAHPTSPGWWELLRALWPVFTVLAGLAIAGIILGLKSIFVTQSAHKDHDARICDVEEFVVQQRTALGLLPSRQQLGEQISRQGEKLTEVKEELSEQIGEQSERIAGLEASVRGVGDQLKTTNTYLHTLLERGLRQ